MPATSRAFAKKLWCIALMFQFHKIRMHKALFSSISKKKNSIPVDEKYFFKIAWLEFLHFQRIFFFYFECKNTWVKRLEKEIKKKKKIFKNAPIWNLCTKPYLLQFITFHHLIKPLRLLTFTFFSIYKKKTRIHSRIINVNVERFVNYSHPLNSFLKKLKIFLAISK